MVQENDSQELSILNERPSLLDGPDLLHELVQSSNHDATAIDFLEHGSKKRRFSYKTLHALSDALACRITRVLAKLESASAIIPVFLPQCPELYIVLLGILKAGKAFCPLNLDTPTERLSFILQDVSADLLITVSAYDERIRAATSVKAMLADRELSEHDDSRMIRLPQASAENLAYVLYTSGSTGLPKAVSVSHRAVTQSLLAHDHHIPAFARFLQFAAPTFDVSIFEIFFPWFRGRTLVGCTRAQMLDDLPATIAALEVDAAELTPTVVSNLLHGRSSVPGLKLLLTIGEMLTQYVIDEYGGNEKQESMLWAMYGPTEAAIHCTLQPHLPTSSSTGTIGYPLDTVSAFVVALSTEELTASPVEILPYGETGELAIGGPQIAEEYLNRSDLTGTSFVVHPVYGRLYRTGDRAKMRDNGTIECLGRVVAGQVKLRGQRVELGEIEQAVMRVRGCRTAIVMVFQESLIAFCATGSQRVSRSTVFETCKRWLPAFMVPLDVCFVDNMPQLPSGKIDRKELEERYLRTLHSNGTSPTLAFNPDDSVAHNVSEIVRQHTARNIGLHSNLALVGLDSLRSIRIASALRREGYGLGAMDVLSATNLGDLIAICRKRRELNGLQQSAMELASTDACSEVLQSQHWSDIACIVPCTPLQEAMLAETIAKPSAYCNWIEVDLSIPYTYEEIQSALQSLGQATEILRTGFVVASQRAGAFNQVIWKDLLSSQIQEVACFSRDYSVRSDSDLLRPFNVQVKVTLERPKLLFRIHHALYDGWSFDLLLCDLHNYLHGKSVAPRPQFQSLARYFNCLAQSENHTSAMGFWTDFLKDYIPPVLPNYNGKLVRDLGLRRFSARSAVHRDTLFERARDLAINPQVFFQAATAYILRLYTGSTDVVLGNVTSGRTVPVDGVEDIIGPCIASVPFRINFEHCLDVRDILHSTQACNRDSLHHSALPLRDIARAANIRPGARLFDVLFVWQQSLTTESEMALDAQVIDSADDLECKLTLEFEPRKDHISLRATFDSSTIPEHQIELLSRQIDEVVQLFLKDFDCAVTEFNRCFTTCSLSIANPNPYQQPIEHGPSHAVEQWASRDPQKEAVSFGHIVDGVMVIKDAATYGMLNSRANQLARVLADHGVGHDQLVGIIMEKSVDLYISILAVLKLGCGYLPLVPDTPTERIKTILRDAQVTVCISESSFSHVLHQDISVSVVDVDLIELSSYSEKNLNIPYNGKHLAYAVFTSGSTGTPKGVLVTQDNLMSNLQCLSSIYPLSATSRMLQSCSQAFDVSVFEIFFSWYVGICLCTARKDDLFYDFEGAINRLQVTHLSLTPTVAALVNPKNVPQVEFLVTAGEALTENVRRSWAGRGLFQGYGPSETTNICTVRAAVSPDDLINNIGPPFDNTSAFVMDPESEAIIPRGAVGELCFGGTQVFRGYLNRPELNAVKIMNHPTYGRIYRSGDMGILLSNDSILSTGRTDDQVKIRGQRVELGEITSVVLDNDAVQDCVTLLVSRVNNVQTLVTFWVPTTKADETCRALEPKEFKIVISESFDLLTRRLPSYMVPSHFFPISCLPMTQQAKIDKRFLQTLFRELAEDTLLHATRVNESDNGPELSLQWDKDVARVLSRTLDVPASELRRTTSFFNLGLDSVSAIRFCNELRAAGLGDFSVSAVLKNPSIGHLASVQKKHLPTTQQTEAATADLANIFPPNQVSQILSQYKDKGLEVARILPCTPLQEAMLSSDQSTSGSAYCNMMIFDVKGDVSQLQECWASMIQRHEILRTSFVSTEDSTFAFAQVILHGYELVWYHHALGSDLQSYTKEAIARLLEGQKPPVYFALAQAGSSTKLLFCCHHALYDGIAIATLINEIQDLYSGYELPPPISYDVYLQHMLGQNMVAADEIWGSMFKDFEPSSFPNLTGKTPKERNNQESLSRCLEIPLSQVRRATQGASVSLLSVVQATWAKLLYYYIGETDVCFGNVVNGRSFPGDDLDRLVAPCFNTLPVRVHFDFNKSNADLMSLTHSLNIDSLAHQLTPLRRIQNIALKEGGHLFDTLVILQQPTSSLDASIWTLEHDLGDMDLPVVCELIQDQVHDTLRLTLHYNTSLISEAEAGVVTETFDTCLSSIITFPQVSAKDTTGLPMHLRAESNMDSERFECNGRLLHSGLEHMASLHPDRVALDFMHLDGARTTWSFKSLNERANDIAHELIDIGAELGQVVPVHISKSPAFYASILGVLKAGAAFAPVHPDLPQARKELMLEELDPRFILCSRDSALKQDAFKSTIIDVDTVPPRRQTNPTIEGLGDSSLAYCLFTSGSTGVPKAVSMEHRAPIQTIESSRTLIPWDSSSKLLQYAAVTFDMCYYDCFLAWTFGFAIGTAEQSALLDHLPEVVNALEADLLDLTPSVAVSLRRSDVPNVKWLYCIGEAMSTEIMKEWHGACVNSYGPTEAAFCTTIQPVLEGTSTSVIGKPFPTTSFAVFSSPGDSPLPILSIGELYIGGAQLARGYFGKPDLTAERFVDKYGQRFYKSGDMVRMLYNGTFEFVGRADDQVKIRGLRVELGEINHVLQNAHPDVVSVTTQIMKMNMTAKEQLVSFLVLHPKIKENERTELQRKLSKVANTQLPAYMVPQFLVFLDRMPRSMAGKIDKKALLKIFCESADANSHPNGIAAHVSGHQWTGVEKQVRDILVRLSKTSPEKIQATTTIYQLGLDSISAVQIAAALRKQGHSVNASDVMKRTTCTALAEYLEQATPSEVQATPQFDFNAFDHRHKRVVSQSLNIKPENIAAIRPCTSLQRGMISKFLAGDGAVYMNYLRMQLRTGVDVSKLREAWATTAKRHVMLRTGFAHVEDSSYPFAMIQYTPNASSLPWTVVPNDDSPDFVENWLHQIQRRALGKLEIPPWEVRIVQGSRVYLDMAIFHALFDAQSLQLLFADVAAAYRNESPRIISSLDSVIGRIIRPSEKENSHGKAFWADLGRTANTCRFPNLAPLRYDSMPPIVCTRQSRKSLHELETGCRRVNASIQAVGIASWLSLLAAYTGERLVTCGVVLSGRNFEAAEHVVFPCINTVPFACAVNQNRGEMLEAVMIRNAEIQQHQFMPLNEIQRFMGFPNEPLFDTIFAYQKLSNGSNTCDLWRTIDERATIEYPVSIELEPREGHLEYRLTFLPHVIPQEQASLILGQLDHLMESFIFQPNTIAAETYFSHGLYSVTPAKDPELPTEAKLLHELVEQTAKRYPKRISLEFVCTAADGSRSVKQWTYSELDAEGNKVAHLLAAHNVHAGNLVGICFDKCPEASFAMLGILKAGCAFVAIDPGAPSARQAFVVEDSQAQAVLSMSSKSTQFEANVDVPVLNLDVVELRSLPRSKLLLNRHINPQDRSYCLYTSGTTGTPKGCELTHENAVQALLAFQRLFAGHWDAESRWLQFASFHFDVSVLEQYWSWSVGICVVSAPRDLIFEDLAKSIHDLGITHIDLTPSLAQILHPDDVPSLCKGVFITGGESLKQEILDVWGPKGVIYNGYGPTEATIGCTMYPRVPANGKPSNIGPQFDNVGSFVLHPGSDIPVFRGGVGELCVSGKLVGKGYLNRPELTMERFPYLERFSERVYRTGDLVRVLCDGTFDFMGRADDQVKLRGQRLEIGEINTIIKQSEKNISDVATLVLKHPKQQKEQLVAFMVFGKISRVEPEILLSNANDMKNAKEACHEKLPPYMVPTHFIPLTTMPLNVNNKADARKLKGLYEDLSANNLQQLSATSNYQDESWSKQDMKIRHLLSDALDVPKGSINKDTSFFELGMDSISVIGVSKLFKGAGFVDATASVIIRYPTIRRLAKSLSTNKVAEIDRGSILASQQAITAAQHRYRRTVAQSLATEPSAIEALAPCTPLQQGMIARSLESHDGLYFNTFKFRLHDEIDRQRLQAAWRSVQTANQILRTVFIGTGEGYVQAVLRNMDFSGLIQTFTEHNHITGHLGKLRERWLELNTADFKQPLEVHLITTDEHKMLVVHIFHGLYDGNSIGLIFQALWDAYDRRNPKIGAPPFHSALPHGPLRVVDGAKDFWQDHLVNATLKTLPALVDMPSNNLVAATRHMRGLTAFENIRRRLNVTAQAIAQSCWLSVLNTHTKGSTATGIVVSGRSIDLEGADRIVGPMFNTIPYHHQSLRSESWASIIKRVHEFNVAAHPYQHTPLRDIMKWCKISNQPLFDTLFVYQVSQEDEEWARNDAWEILEGDVVADYPLAFEVEQKANDEFALTIIAQGHILNEQKSLELLDQFEKALYQVLEDPSIVVELPVSMNDPHEAGVSMENRSMSDADGTPEFDWTDNAVKIREEIAILAGIHTSNINQATSILELGLDSIDSIKLSSRLKKCGVDLPVSNIMRGLTIANMVSKVSVNNTREIQSASRSNLDVARQKLQGYLQEHAIGITDFEDVLPLTPLQEAMVAEMIASNYSRYYNHDVLKISPDTDEEKIRTAWTTVVAASPILRTCFLEIDDPDFDGSFAQIVLPQPHEFWSHTTLTDEPKFNELFDGLRADAVVSPSLVPPFRVTFVETPSQSYLLLSIAHALYDGWSLGLIHSDVHLAYHNQYSFRPNYNATLAEILSASGSAAAQFWQDYLLDAKASSFPRRAKALNKTNSVVHRCQQDSGVALADLQSFARKGNVSLQTIGQAVFALVLASYSSSLDVTFGSVLSGRDDDERSQLMFPTMNTVAIRTILHGNCIEILRYVQDNFTNIKQWQHYPLRKALSQAGVDGNLFESLFIYQKSLEQSLDGNERLYTSIENHSNVEYPVCVEMEVMHDTLVWRCAVKEEVFDEAEGTQLLDKLDEVLRYVMERPETPVIEVTSEGTSVCGLQAFKEANEVSAKHTSTVSEDHDESTSNTKIAQNIRNVLAAVSKTPEDEITSNMTIFHMGLDSISAIKVSSLLRKKGLILSVGEMLRAGTVTKMAQVVNGRAAQVPADTGDNRCTNQTALQGLDREAILQRAGINESDVLELLPVTAGQLYMLSMWINTKGSNFYPEFRYEVQGNVPFEVLENSWKALVKTHPILRTSFIQTGSNQMPYVQIVLREVESIVADTTGCTEDEGREYLHQTASQQPWAHLFVSPSKSGWTLKFKVHHALYDGFSLPLFIHEYQELCNGIATPPSDNTSIKLVTSGYTVSALEQRKIFWEKYLSDVTQHSLPQPSTTPKSKTEIFKPSLLPILSVESIARRHGISTQSIFLAAYAKSYAMMIQIESNIDIVIGIYLANRSLPIEDIASAAVPTVNLLPLRVTTPLDCNLLETAAQIQRNLQEISSPVNTHANLFEISEWTSVKVDTFVNFLSLPDTGGTEKTTQHESAVTVNVIEQWQRPVSRVSAIEDETLEVPSELVNEQVNKAYLHAIDVEATVRKGALDVGIFAPTDMLSLREGESLMENIKQELKRI